MNQKKLSEALGGVVEDCVNKVGLDLNTASFSLLEYISGISKPESWHSIRLFTAQKTEFGLRTKRFRRL